jgi:hypothetical protein
MPAIKCELLSLARQILFKALVKGTEMREQTHLFLVVAVWTFLLFLVPCGIIAFWLPIWAVWGKWSKDELASVKSNSSAP